MFAFKLVCLISALAGTNAGLLGAGIAPLGYPHAPIVLPSAPILPNYGLLPYAAAPFAPIGCPAPIIKSHLGFGYPTPIVKPSLGLAYPYHAPIIKSHGHFDYHETPIVKLAPLGLNHVKSHFGYPHAHLIA